MCYEEKCTACGKSGWGGCGRHVPSVYKRIPQGQHCMCRQWPGVADLSTSTTADASQAESTSNCSIL